MDDPPTNMPLRDACAEPGEFGWALVERASCAAAPPLGAIALAGGGFLEGLEGLFQGAVLVAPWILVTSLVLVLMDDRWLAWCLAPFVMLPIWGLLELLSGWTT